MIVLLRKVRQDEEFRTTIIVRRQKICECVIRQMANPAHHALLYRPWIRAAAQHLQVVVRFNHQYLAPADMLPHACWHIPQIGTKADFDALTAKGEPYRIDCVMRDGEWRDPHVADLKRAAGMKLLAPLQLDPIAFPIARGSAIGFMRRSRDVHRNLQPFCQHTQSAYVVAMFMCDQDGVNAARSLAALCQPPQKFATRQSCVDQQSRGVAGDEGAIPLAPARQPRDGHSHSGENKPLASPLVVTSW